MEDRWYTYSTFPTGTLTGVAQLHAERLHTNLHSRFRSSKLHADRLLEAAMQEVKVPQLDPVVSSNVHSCGHDGQHGYIRFHGKNGEPGPLYRYPNLDPTLIEQLKGSASAGRFFHSMIKHLPAEKVAG